MDTVPADKRRASRRRSRHSPSPNIVLRGKVYYARTQVDGRERRVSLGTNSLQEAHTRLPGVLDSLRQDKQDPTYGVLWQCAAMAYLEALSQPNMPDVKASTLDRYSLSWESIAPWFDGVRLHQIDQQFLKRFIRERKAIISPKTGRPITNSTLNRDLTSVSVVLDYAVHMGWLTQNLALALGSKRFGRREEHKRYPLPTWPQIEMMASATSSSFGDVIRLLALTGCRLNEVITLTRSQLLRQADGELSLVLTHTKNGRLRTIRLNSTARAIVEAQKAHATSPYLFWTGVNGTPFKEAPGRFRNIRNAVAAKEGKEGRSFPHFRAHDLRHFWGIMALRGGVSIYAVSRHLGHTSVKTTEQFYLDSLDNDDELRARLTASLVDEHGMRYDPSITPTPDPAQTSRSDQSGSDHPDPDHLVSD